ncbi:MAG: GNAT family N-acetyltransferase [Streptosporangiaceae bacterium]
MPTDQTPAVLFRLPSSTEAGWLVCRRVQRGDADDLYQAVLASLDHLRPWMAWVADGYTRQEAEDFTIRHTSTPRDAPVPGASYAVRDRSGEFLGICGLHGRPGPGALEIGYWVDVRHARRGITTLAAAMLTELALTLPGIQTVEIHHDQANVASGAIPAKLGYTHVATEPDLREAPGDIGLDWRWVLHRNDYPASPAAHLLATVRTT